MATKQFLMLDKISMEYHSFRKDQVLTHKHLNDLIDYFEDQDRLTRTCLVGVGLVCGLGITIDTAVPSVSVGKGCGVTTDGDLLVFDATEFKDFKPYDNRKKGTPDPIYDPFWPATDGNKQIGLWQLVIKGSDGNLPVDSLPLSSFKATTGNVLEDMTALLYLENYLQDPDKCTAIDCDNQGAHQVAEIKVLLLSKADMEKVINRDPAQEVIADSIYKKYHEPGVQYFDLPLLKARRVILNNANTSAIALLANSYTGIVQSDGGKLIKAVADLYNAFGFMIDPARKTIIDQLKNDLRNALTAKHKIYHAQYVYDYYKDILCAYNELREMLFKCVYECCPDKYAFPKHLMLGELKPAGSEPAPYRHEFYPSPALSGNKDKLAQCRSYWKRLELMIRGFNIADQPTDVRITPSSDYDQALGNRAVPFYYKDIPSIVHNWNYAMSSRGAEANILSYHAGQYAGGLESTIRPLDYNIDSNNFFRIEGHLGQTLNDAMNRISKIQKDSAVPFDMVAVRLNKTGNLSDINTDDFDCQFEDLNAILKSWLVEQNCLYANISRFFSGFSTKGVHTRINDYREVEAQPVLFTNTSLRARVAATGTLRVTAPLRFSSDLGIAATLAPVNVTNIAAAPKTVAVEPICKTIYTIDKTVVANLETADKSLGLHFSEAFKQPFQSADDIIRVVKDNTKTELLQAGLSAVEKEVAYDVPITLVAHISGISQLKPFTLNEINIATLEKYIERMENLCAYVKKLPSRVESIFNNTLPATVPPKAYVRTGFENYYLFLIQELIANCCAAEKLENLHDEINKRKQKILDSLLFSNYVSQHTGLEHKAGVHRGGTFVLVYAQDIRTRAGNTQLLAFDDIAATAKVAGIPGNTDDIMLSPYKDPDSFAYYLVTNQGKTSFEDEMTKYLRQHGIVDGSVAEQQLSRLLQAKIKDLCARLTKEEEATIAANVVIADFTLPYLCCSDCPPMVFIMPKQEFNLSLPKAAACSDEAMLLFRKEPANGVVTSNPAFTPSVIFEKDGNTFFDPSKVPATSLGKDISFAINDQVTACRIQVFKHPDAKAEFKVESQNADQIVIVFSNKSDDPTGKEYVYAWDFGDGRPVQKVDDQKPIPITYKKEVLEKMGLNGIITVKLTATNGPCFDDAEPLKVPYEKDVPVALSLPNEFVCKGAAQLKFTVQPLNGLVASAEDPDAVVKINNEFFFDPKKAKTSNKLITFTVNGKPTSCHITVFPPPKAAFEAGNAVFIPGPPPFMELAFKNLTDATDNPQLKYLWEFSDGTANNTDKQVFTLRFNIDALKALGQNALLVRLTVTNPGCEDKTEKSVPFPVPPPVTNCGDTVIAAIKADLSSLSTADISSFLSSIQTTPPSPLFIALSAQYKEAQNIVGNALQQVNTFNQPNVQAILLRSLMGPLQKMYTNTFDKRTNAVVIVPEVRALLKLAFNIIKCEAVVSGATRELITAIMNDFNQNAGNILQLMPSLNKENALNAFFKDYFVSTKLTDAQLLDLMKQFAAKIRTSFLP